jgi:Fe(3+) dicitrate transport protein
LWFVSLLLLSGIFINNTLLYFVDFYIDNSSHFLNVDVTVFLELLILNYLTAVVSFSLIIFFTSYSTFSFANAETTENSDASFAAVSEKSSIKSAVGNSVKTFELNDIYITGGKDEVLQQPGSATLIDNIALDTFEYTDIHRVLNAVPGVNLQEEDGYGLRPNIGLRGTSPERSKKITIMEDGILSGPAPYAAPAAYYFPNISRMSAVEVFKGPSAIQYGPATVGGAINLVSREIPYVPQGELDVQYGSDSFQRYNVYQGQQIEDFGYLVEALRVSAEGFKNLDSRVGNNGDANTGFLRNDFNLKTSWQSRGLFNQFFLLKVGYADEESNETYLGLTRDDFEQDPYRRYSASQLDKMEWDHQQYQFTHVLELARSTITTDVYRNEFNRDWLRLSGFNNNDSDFSLVNILGNNKDANYQPYYDVLTGAASIEESHQLRIGNNGRQFFSQGIQTRINQDLTLFGFEHGLEVGVRIHQDQVKRHHSEQNYNTLAGGELQAVSGTYKTTARNTNNALALAIYIQDEIHIDNTVLSLGLRHESIETSKTIYGKVTGIKESENTLIQSIFLPGIGVYSQLSKELGVLAGIYKGFTAATANAAGETKPEESISFELGSRFSGFLAFGGKAEVIGFLNNYTEFSSTCSFSQGSCDSNAAGEQTNAGITQVYGLETSWSKDLLIAGYTLPALLSYTYSYGEFGEQFVDSAGAFGEQGQVIEIGYRIGYLPEHRLNAQLGLGKDDWRVNVSVLYQSDMRNVPGEGVIPLGELIEARTVFDVSASYDVLMNFQLYSTIDNVLNEQYVAGVKPYGFRPGKSRSVNVGAKYQF